MSSGWDSKIHVFITKVASVSCYKTDLLVTTSSFCREGNSDFSDFFFFFLTWQYLTTVIPYEKKNGPPSVEDLQVLTKSKPRQNLLPCLYLLIVYILILIGWFCCYCFVLSIWDSKWWISLCILSRMKP